MYILSYCKIVLECEQNERTYKIHAKEVSFEWSQSVGLSLERKETCIPSVFFRVIFGCYIKVTMATN